MPEFDPTDYSVQGLLRCYGGILDELIRRDIIRTYNSPIGDYAEWLVADKLGLKLNDNSNIGCDAIGPTGTRYQIKARWLQAPSSSRQISTIRGLEDAHFDFLIAVLFAKDCSVAAAYRIPHHHIAGFSRFVPRVNGHNLLVQGDLLNADGVADITALFAPQRATVSAVPKEPLPNQTAPRASRGEYPSLSKADALARINNVRSSSKVTNGNTHFANRVIARDFWWLEVPRCKINSGADRDIHLLLYDGADDTLHHLEVPAAYFRSNITNLGFREDVDKVSLKLALGPPTPFQDMRSRGGGVRFGQFLRI